jgi:hypothetical protein
LRPIDPPANAGPRNAIVIARRMIWWFYCALKDDRQAPRPENTERLRARFDRVFSRMRAGYATLDKLLKRLFRLKDELLRVLERPGIPLNTNPSENDIRAVVTKRNLRRNRQRKRTHRPRRHARPRQDLRQPQNLVLPLCRRPPRDRRPARPATPKPHRPNSKLSQPPGNLPRLLGIGLSP